MKVTIELTDDDSYLVPIATHLPQVFSRLNEIDNKFRNRLEYGNLGEQATSELEAMRDMFREYFGNLISGA